MTSKLLVFWKTGREERWLLITRLYTVYIIVSLILVLFCVFVCLFVCLFSQFVSHSETQFLPVARLSLYVPRQEIHQNYDDEMTHPVSKIGEFF